jgi:hypothetical protein
MRALLLVAPLTLQTIGEAMLYARLGIPWAVLRPLVVNAICWGVGAVIDIQRRGLFIKNSCGKSC